MPTTLATAEHRNLQMLRWHFTKNFWSFLDVSISCHLFPRNRLYSAKILILLFIIWHWHRPNDWPTDRPTYWLTDRPTDINNWFTDWLTDQPTSMTDLLTDWPMISKATLQLVSSLPPRLELSVPSALLHLSPPKTHPSSLSDFLKKRQSPSTWSRRPQSLSLQPNRNSRHLHQVSHSPPLCVPLWRSSRQSQRVS